MRKKVIRPVRALREPLGTAGLIVAIVALAAALAGGAYAASGALTGKQKKEVEKIARKVGGKAGLVRVEGTPTPGAAGAAGREGTAGKEGVAGKEGARGEVGETGFTETLPPGKSETGVWSSQFPYIVHLGEFGSPISFPIPVALEAGQSGQAFFIDAAEVAAGTGSRITSSGCTGTGALPSAPSGELCVYAHHEENEGVSGSSHVINYTGPFSPLGFGPAGATLNWLVVQAGGSEPASIEAQGTWAVTAP
jgi:hypothetical protein